MIRLGSLAMANLHTVAATGPDSLECLKPVWAEIAAPNRGQYHHRHHCHAADPNDDSKDMQRARNGEIVHATLRPRLRPDPASSKAGPPAQAPDCRRDVYRAPEGRPACSGREPPRTPASPREARAAARSIPRSGKS